MLSTRARTELSEQEVQSFSDALRIFPTNERVRQYNTEHLIGLGKPCIQAIASNTGCRAAEEATADTAGNLHSKLPLCQGAKVMLTENIWTEAGLVNGALGTIFDIAWASGENPRISPPFVTLIWFKGYSGPPYFLNEPSLEGVIPIFRSEKEFIVQNKHYFRTQFPLTIAYAITVHKSQGATLDQAVLDISGKDFQLGLTYVAVSRVKTLQGILFDAPFEMGDITM